MTARYRWVILAAGSVGAGAFAALRMGLPALGPAIRDAYGATLSEVGLAFAAVGAGTMMTLVLWGMLTDRIGERPVMAVGLMGTALALVAAALASSFAALVLALLVAGMLGASATGASGRAVMGWFDRSERGFALGVRQMALPLGGSLASLTLPLLVDLDGLRGAFLALAGLAMVGALTVAGLMRDAPPRAAALVPPPPRPSPIRDQRLWRLGAGSALLIVAQNAMLAFVVLFLHDARGVPVATAAAALAAILLLGAGGRLLAGRRSDQEGLRVAPVRRIAARSTVLVALVAVLVNAPGVLLYPVLLCAAVSTMTWNGLAFAAAGEIAGIARAGTAMSMQTTILAVAGALTPFLFGGLVEALSWHAGFAILTLAPLVAFVVLRPLEGDEDDRIAARERRLRDAALQAKARAVEATP